MIKNFKYFAKIYYISSSFLIFAISFLIPITKLILDDNQYKCEGCEFISQCNFLYNLSCSVFYLLLYSIILIAFWSVFYFQFYLIFFSNDKSTEKLNIKNFYLKYLQFSIRGRKIQSLSIVFVMLGCYALLVKLFIYRLMTLFT